MHELIFRRLTSAGDPDVPAIRDMLSGQRFVSIDADSYFTYVTGTDGVYFYKIYTEGRLCAVLHAENPGRSLSVMITVVPGMRRQGIGKQVISDLCRRLGEYGCTGAEAYIEPENTASAALFRSCGFRRAADEDGLQRWVYEI